MKRGYIFILLLIITGNLMIGQELPDQIITKSGDTLNCKITLVNDQNIFYDFKKKKTKKHSYISLKEVVSYSWISNSPEYIDPDKKEFYAYDSTHCWIMGIRATQQMNYPIAHSIVAAGLSRGSHNFYCGPVYTKLLENYFGDEVVDIYDEDIFGVNFGYRYLFKSAWKKTNIFLQYDFSFYKAKFKRYGGHAANTVDDQRINLENNASIGINHKISKRMELFAGAGLGSVRSFFLVLDKSLFHTYLGVGYNFR